MKKIFAAMFLAAIIFSVGSQVQAKDFNFGANDFQFTPMTTGRVMNAQVVYGIDFLALRTGPSVKYREILRMPPGAYLEVIYGGADRWWNTDFVSVRYKGIDGYASSRYIKTISVKYEIP